MPSQSAQACSETHSRSGFELGLLNPFYTMTKINMAM